MFIADSVSGLKVAALVSYFSAFPTLKSFFWGLVLGLLSLVPHSVELLGMAEALLYLNFSAVSLSLHPFFLFIYQKYDISRSFIKEYSW